MRDMYNKEERAEFRALRLARFTGKLPFACLWRRSIGQLYIIFRYDSFADYAVV